MEKTKTQKSKIKQMGKRALVPSIVLGIAVVIASLVVILRKLKAFSKIAELWKRKK